MLLISPHVPGAVSKGAVGRWVGFKRASIILQSQNHGEEPGGPSPARTACLPQSRPHMPDSWPPAGPIQNEGGKARHSMRVPGFLCGLSGVVLASQQTSRPGGNR